MTSETRTVPFLLTAHRFSTLAQDIPKECCLACSMYLDLHQPDSESPDRLVGICDQCGRWYLIDMMPEKDEAVMILLPEGDSVEEALIAVQEVV